MSRCTHIRREYLDTPPTDITRRPERYFESLEHDSVDALELAYTKNCVGFVHFLTKYGVGISRKCFFPHGFSYALDGQRAKVQLFVRHNGESVALMIPKTKMWEDRTTIRERFFKALLQMGEYSIWTTIL